jgi:hypothetical protein
MSATRRGILAGAGAAMVLPATTRAPAEAAASPDAALIAEVEEFLRVNDLWLDALAESAGLDGEAYKAAERKADAIRDCGGYSERLIAISEKAARTIEGLQAKARAALAHCDGDPPFGDEVAWSLLEDVLAMGQAA